MLLDKLAFTENKYEELSVKISDPSIMANQKEWRKLCKEHADLEIIVTAYREYKKVLEDLEANKEMLEEESDKEMREMLSEEISMLKEQEIELENKIQILLLPKDPNDDKNVFVEIRGGAGGDEAALFAANLFRMYTRYADDLSFSGDINVGLLISFTTNILNRFGFSINQKKTKVISQGRSQQVTGIVVNKKIQVPRLYRNKLRQEIYYIIKYGLENHLNRINYSQPPLVYLYHLLGKTNYIIQINKYDKEAHKYMEYLKNLLQTYTKSQNK